METQLPVATKVPWNKGKLVGQKAPLKLRDIGGIWGQAYASGIWGHVRHVGSRQACGVRSFIIIFLEDIHNNINIKCDNKRPDPFLC